MALPSAQTEWAQFHLATDDVRRRGAGKNPHRCGKIHVGKPLESKSRRELIASLRPNYLKHLRADNGDLPDGAGSCVDSNLARGEMDFEKAPQTLKVLS